MTAPRSEIFATDASEGVTWNRAMDPRVSPGDSRDSIRRSLRDSAPGLDLHGNVAAIVRVKRARVTDRLPGPPSRVRVSTKNDVLTVVASPTVPEEDQDDPVLMADRERPTE